MALSIFNGAEVTKCGAGTRVKVLSVLRYTWEKE